MMTTVTVTIGRNIGERAMGADAWRRFQQQVRNVLESHGTLLFDGDGDGQWEGEHEGAHAFVALFDTYWRSSACFKLDAIRVQHQQDAIAWTEGLTFLVGIS